MSPHSGRQAGFRYAGSFATSWEMTMRLIIEARVEDPDARDATAGAVTLAVVERRKGSLAELGLTLAEGRDLLAQAQSALVSQQVGGWMTGQTDCRRCGSALSHKDSRSIVLRTVFGKVEVSSPRLWTCGCGTKRGAPRRSVSPLCKALPNWGATIILAGRTTNMMAGGEESEAA